MASELSTPLIGQGGGGVLLWVETPVFEDTVEGDLIAILPMFYVVAIVGFEVAIMRSGMSGPQKLTTALLVVVVGLALLPVIAAIVQSLVG
jgi:hypothetical protein